MLWKNRKALRAPLTRILRPPHRTLSSLRQCSQPEPVAPAPEPVAVTPEPVTAAEHAGVEASLPRDEADSATKTLKLNKGDDSDDDTER